MKRNDMIKSLEITIQEHKDKGNDYSLAYVLLTKMEILGMLPPCSDPNIKDYISKYAELFGNTWEVDNEE